MRQLDGGKGLNKLAAPIFLGTLAVLGLFLPLSVSALPAPESPVVEEPGLFKMRRVESPQEKGFRYWGTRWRTDSELLIKAAQYKDWKAQGAWDQRIFRWNIDTDEIANTPYVGNLVCATASRLVVLRVVPDASDPAKKKSREVYSGAVFGEPVTPIASSVYNKYSCEPMERRISRDFGPDTVLLALLPGHGRILEKIKPLERAMWFLPEDSAERIQIGAGTAGGFGEETNYDLGRGCPSYIPWLGQYFLWGATGDHRIQRSGTYDVTLYFLSPNGHIDTQHEPMWINAAKKANRLSVSYVATRAGVVWLVASPFRGRASEFDGLYLERDGRLIRFLRHASLSQDSVSPGGCRALVMIDPTGQNFPHDGKPELHLINFCEETKQ